MARRRRFTLGRAFALLILGIGVGAVLFVGRHLRPEALEAQVLDVLGDLVAEDVDYSVDAVELDLETGVELRGLTIRYPDPALPPAIEVERVVLAVDHRQLLRGEVDIRQVDIHGLVVRLRPATAHGGLPELPGVFRPTPGTPTFPSRLPVVRIHGGRGGSGVEVLGHGLLDEGVPMRLSCVQAEVRTEDGLHRLHATFAGEKLDRLALKLALDPATGVLRGSADVADLHWQSGDVALLADHVRRSLPPVEAAGRADVSVRAELELEPFRVRHAEGHADIRDLDGAFGNLHTGEPKGFPFRLRNGRGRVSYADGHVALSGFETTYVGPEGVEGTLGATVALDLDRVAPHLDVHLWGKGVRASTQDLRDLLPTDVVEAIVDPFLPAGSFDFDLFISQRPALPEKVVARLQLSDGAFDYAGQLDALTGKRFGFRYPLGRASGDIRIETHVPTAHGLAQVIRIRDVRGFNPIARPQPGGPKDVVVRAAGDVIIYTTDPGEPTREDVDIRIDVDELPIDAKLATAFASTPRGMPYGSFDLAGWADELHIRVRRRPFAENVPLTTYDVTLRDCSMAYEDFPLRIEAVSGRIVSRDLPPDEAGRHWRVLELRDLEGHARDGGRIRGRGLVSQSDDGTEELELRIEAHELFIGDNLAQAIERSPAAEAGVLDLWQRFRPYGTLDVTLSMPSPRDVRIDIDLAGTTSLRGYEDVACAADGLEGHIRYADGTTRLDGITGRLVGTPFHLAGSIREGGAFDLRGGLTGLVLDEAVQDVAAQLLPGVRESVRALALTPRSSLDVTLEAGRAGADRPVQWSAELGDLALESGLLGLDLLVRGGPLRVDGDSVRGRDLRLRAGDGEVRIRELSAARGGGSGWAVLEARNLEPIDHLDRVFGGGFGEVLGHNLRLDLQGFRVELDRDDRTVILSGAVDLRRHRLLDEEVDALEPTGAIGLTPLTLRLPREPGGPLRLSGIVEFSEVNLNLPLDVRDLGGELRIADGTITPEFRLKGAIFGGEATVFERYVDELSLNLSYDPHYLRLGNMDGRFYQGTFHGDVQVHLAEPSAFRVRLRAAGVELGEMLKEDLPRDEPMSGSMDAALEIDSPSGEPEDMTGRGEIRVREGALFRVPGLRRLLAVLSRATPLSEQNRFRRAEADFDIRGETLDIRRIHLSTKLNDIHAHGAISIYGDLDLVVEPQVTRLIDLPRLLDVPVLSALRDLWHRTVYEIRLEGTLESPALRLRALPFLRRRGRVFTQSPHAGRAERIRPRLLP